MDFKIILNIQIYWKMYKKSVLLNKLGQYYRIPNWFTLFTLRVLVLILKQFVSSRSTQQVAAPCKWERELSLGTTNSSMRTGFYEHRA